MYAQYWHIVCILICKTIRRKWSPIWLNKAKIDHMVLEMVLKQDNLASQKQFNMSVKDIDKAIPLTITVK